MKLELVTPATSEPVALVEQKEWSKVEYDDDDAILYSLIKQARDYAEKYTQRSVPTQTWKLYIDEFPDKIILPMPPLQSVTSIKYIDDDGNEQTLAAAEYSVDSVVEPACIVEAFEKTWPSTRSIPNAVTIEFVAGYDSVPETIKTAIMSRVDDQYENRGSVVIGHNASQVNTVAFENLLNPYRVHPA